MPKGKHPEERQCPDDSILSSHFPLFAHGGHMLCLSCCSCHGKGRCYCLVLALGTGSRTGWSLGKPGISSAPARRDFSLGWFSSGKSAVLWMWSLLETAELSGRAQPAVLHPPESHQSFSCAQEHLFLREALEGRSISDHKLQTPWLSWQLHHKICFFTFSQAPSWNFSDFSSLLFLLGPEPLRRTGIFSNLCPRCNQLIFFFPLCQKA